MTSRRDEMTAFLSRAGWRDAEIAPLAGDASNRRYERLEQQDGQRAVLMDAPPQTCGSLSPFVQIAEHLVRIGLSAPQIYAQDAALGFLLLEDLGDDLFARVIERQPDREDQLYQAAIDVLVHVHRAPPPDLAPFDAATTAPLAALVFDWYQFGATGVRDSDVRATFCQMFQALLTPLDSGEKVLIQRDYHAENLLWLPERQGPARVGLLDFQDAVLGHPAYDLVSVLQDARRDLAPGLEERMMRRFLDQSGLDAGRFSEGYALLGAQRQLRILGVFARLCLRDGKAHYIDFIPRVWAHLQTNLHHPALAEFAGFLAEHLITPTPDVLKLLRSKCATCPDL